MVLSGLRPGMLCSSRSLQENSILEFIPLTFSYFVPSSLFKLLLTIANFGKYPSKMESGMLCLIQVQNKAITQPSFLD
jgi:hypothetical protein